MASLLIRNLPESTKKALRRRAAGHGHSMEEEARLILTSAMRHVPASRRGLGTRLLEIGKLAEGHELEIQPRTELPRKPPFLTDEEWDAK